MTSALVLTGAPGTGKSSVHAQQLARTIPTIEGVDVVIDTEGRDPADVARVVHDVLRHELGPRS
jgi:broad-specificity NMP kinase